MAKKHHPANRYERMRIKEIKDEHTTGRSSRLWRKTRETETVKELDDEIITEQIR